MRWCPACLENFAKDDSLCRECEKEMIEVEEARREDRERMKEEHMETLSRHPCTST